MAVHSEHQQVPASGLQEILVTVLLVVATVATAWGSYQAAGGTVNKPQPPAAPAP